ncbi:RNB domain-containing ribonuclease [Knoellia sp. 3-2P3]|uniref:RNB domain-containing ribonuclease n=1 Tax=unclassified Knoellia TaxID=2618719 RepID=UPI0023DC5D0A|nr:RNB domain-containing ribonuclease [Knoellia sp. 3-2P3]MDF2094188.1 RNB domain-containing ribonuclease [Knoellia sp. 3-2P3]
MPRPIKLAPPGSATSVAQSEQLRARFDAIRAEQGVPEAFPAGVLAEARAVAASAALPDRDETSVPFVTIDPPGSMDLDQALHLARDGEGYRVRYAIADVPAFVAPGGALDDEARRRGQTIYAPDRRTPLHPPELSEGAASLLPAQVRPAYVWDLRVAPDGEATSAEVYRALVRSRERHDYDGVQEAVDAGAADEVLVLLKEVGEKRIALERKRGGASLPMPEQEVSEDGEDHYRLHFRPLVAAEDWNAQLSLMAGMAAAEIMLKGGVGILRTMPTPEPGAMARFRREARALGVQWHEEQPYGEFLRSLDRTNPLHLALVHEATALFRGAGYTPFDGEAPPAPEHAAVAAPYAHVTAPLRRLVDRFGLVVCEALCRGAEVPAWAREALPRLPEAMQASDRVAGAVERACADAVEAAVLVDRVGEVFDAVVVDDRNSSGVLVQLHEPAVVAMADGRAELGSTVQARLVAADIATSTVRFAVAGQA